MVTLTPARQALLAQLRAAGVDGDLGALVEEGARSRLHRAAERGAAGERVARVIMEGTAPFDPDAAAAAKRAGLP